MKPISTKLSQALAVFAFMSIAGAAVAVPAPVICPDAGATTDLTTAGATTTINDAIFTSVDGSGSVGTGVFPAFVKINGNDDCVSGYNTDGTLEFDTNNSPIVMFTLDTMDVVSQGGIDYVQFILDINQERDDPLLSLDNVQIFVSTFDNLTGWSSNCTLGGVSCVYNMDLGTNVAVLLDYSLNSGSGNGFDMSLLVPTSVFGGVADPSKTYVYLYSAFGSVGGAYIENDGPEEWAYRRCPAGEVCWQTPGPDPNPAPEPGTLALIGIALVAVVAGGRRRSAARTA